MEKLFSFKQTWLHYIGKSYTVENFLREARSIGITRRSPADVISSMQFGDRVVFLRYGGIGKVSAIGEMIVRSITFENEIGSIIGSELEKDGLATFSPGGSLIVRECGSFIIAGTFQVNASLPEIIKKAQELANQRGETLFVMIGGELTQEYSNPPFLYPAPKFFRIGILTMTIPENCYP